MFVLDAPDYHLSSLQSKLKLSSCEFAIDNWLTNSDVELLVAVVTFRHHINKFLCVSLYVYVCTYVTVISKTQKLVQHLRYSLSLIKSIVYYVREYIQPKKKRQRARESYYGFPGHTKVLSTLAFSITHCFFLCLAIVNAFDGKNIAHTTKMN